MATRDELGLQARYDIGKSLIDLEPSAIIELYELYFNVTEQPFRFHAGTNNLTKDITWNGNTYYSSAIEVEGFEANIVGRLPRPKVTIANTNYIISSILRDYSDFRNGKFVRVKLFLKHLDASNFDDNENPFGTPDPLAYISKEKYLVSQKIIENKEIFRVDPKILKKVIDDCYCKYVSSKQNEELYTDISYLLGLYAYTKDKVHIKPYVVIGKNL